jgi:2-amino-4-hydroxy-6-hydroxymethyldihydropteridine diphosphokinase
MSLVLATGSNIGNKKEYLDLAKTLLSQKFQFIAESRIYESDAVDYLNQPSFFNQVLEFDTPAFHPDEILAVCLEIESELGRERKILRGPRTIDIDIIFLDFDYYQTPKLTIPHPRAFERSFVVQPLKDLPCFETYATHFKFSDSFPTKAIPISE